jgi:hypothetical protein
MDADKEGQTSAGEGQNTDAQQSAGSTQAGTSAATREGHLSTDDRSAVTDEINRVAAKIREEERLKTLREVEAENKAAEKRRQEESEATTRKAEQDKAVAEGRINDLVRSHQQDLDVLRGRIAQAEQIAEQAQTQLRTITQERDDLSSAVTVQIKEELKALPKGTADLVPEGLSPAAQLKWLHKYRRTVSASATRETETTNGGGGNKQETGEQGSTGKTSAESENGSGERKPGNPANPPARGTQTQENPARTPRDELVNQIIDEGKHSGRYSY